MRTGWRLADGPPPSRGRGRPRWPLVAVLAVLVVAAAGLSRPVRFTGPRWLPHSTQHDTETPSLSATASSGSTARVLPKRAASHGSSLIDSIVAWALLAGVVVLALVLLRRWYARRPARHGSATERSGHLTAVPAGEMPPAAEAVAPEQAAPVLRSGVEQALDLLDADLEPADAVLQAWLGLQRSAEQSGIVRRAAETPTEFTTRITGQVFADDGAIRVLLQRYLQVRFGRHDVTADDVAAVRAALRDLARTWNARLPGRTR